MHVIGLREGLRVGPIVGILMALAVKAGRRAVQLQVAARLSHLDFVGYEAHHVSNA